MRFLREARPLFKGIQTNSSLESETGQGAYFLVVSRVPLDGRLNLFALSSACFCSWPALLVELKMRARLAFASSPSSLRSSFHALCLRPLASQPRAEAGVPRAVAAPSRPGALPGGGLRGVHAPGAVAASPMLQEMKLDSWG